MEPRIHTDAHTCAGAFKPSRVTSALNVEALLHKTVLVISTYRRIARLGPVLMSGILLVSGCSDPVSHIPPFARRPYETLSRAAVVAIALREWRLFGQKVGDGEDARDLFL